MHIAWRSDRKALVFIHDNQLYQLSQKRLAVKSVSI
jgi:hypothetical protein